MNSTHKTSFFAFLTVLLLIWPSSISASHKPLVPLPSVFDFSKGDGWAGALGLGIEYETAYDGSDEYEFEVDPIGAVHYRQGRNLYFWEGMELGMRRRTNEKTMLQLNLRYESGRERDDSEDGRLNGLNEPDSELVGVIEMRRSLDKNWRNWFAFRYMGGNSDFGSLGVIAFGHRFDNRTDGTGTEAFVFSTFGDSDFMNRDFGVTQPESVRSGLPATTLDSGYRSTGLTVVNRRQVRHKNQIITQLELEFYGGEIADSPISRNDYEAELSVSYVWHFW